MKIWSLLFFAALAAAPQSWFEDVTVQAGVAHKHTNRSFRNPYADIMAGYTALGAAAAVADYDGDGYRGSVRHRFGGDWQESSLP